MRVLARRARPGEKIRIMSNIKPAVIRGIDIVITVDSDGWFHAGWKDERYTAQTRDELTGQLTAAAKEEDLQVAVPFCVISGHGELKRGTAHGIHSRTGSALARVEGKAFTYRPYEPVLADLPDEIFTELAQALERKRAAEQEIERITTAHHLPLVNRITEALQAAAGTPAGD